MKKLTSLIMMLAMLLSLCAVSASAEKDGGQTNMEVTVPKFTAQPEFDGIVSEKEWGEVTVHMVTYGAATVDNAYTIGENAYARNIFYHKYNDKYTDSLSYDLWLRWDKDYFYVAAIVNDPDPFSLPEGEDGIWCGDCLQLKIDDKGPSAAMYSADPGFDYRTDSFDGERFNDPWSNAGLVFNGALGLVRGQTPTLWRFGLYNAAGWDLSGEGGLVGISYVQNEDGTCVTQYEGAIPWSSLSTGGSLNPSAGDVYGITVSVACMGKDDDWLNAWLQWGMAVHSVTNYSSQPVATRGGSQAMILSNDTVTPGGKVEEPEPPVDDTEKLSPEAEAFYRERYVKMTPEEIVQFEKYLKGLGITKEEYYQQHIASEEKEETTESTDDTEPEESDTKTETETETEDEDDTEETTGTAEDRENPDIVTADDYYDDTEITYDETGTNGTDDTATGAEKSKNKNKDKDEDESSESSDFNIALVFIVAIGVLILVIVVVVIILVVAMKKNKKTKEIINKQQGRQ